MAISLYRKYRPNVFADVVGQEHVENTLVNAVREDNVAHAYLFCGPRGTGKTTTARLLAKALLCKLGPTPEPCGTCEACVEIADGLHPDVYELDAASHTGVDNVREEIISRVQFAPTHGRYKVYIIDEVHMLSTQAFNALLKTLEEPPAHVVFVLCTTEPHKVLDTIQSRCQRFDFRRFSVEEIVTYLRRICDTEKFEADTEALSIIAAKSNGGMRDATTALEQVSISSNGKISVESVQQQLGQDTSQLFDFVDAIAQHRTADCFMQIQNMVNDGRDLGQFSKDLSKHIRNIYVASIMGDEQGLIACSKQELSKYKEQAKQFGGQERISHALAVCGELAGELRHSSDARLSTEIACTRLCRPNSDISLQALAARIEQLESGACVVEALPHANQVAAPSSQQIKQAVTSAQDVAEKKPVSKDSDTKNEKPAATEVVTEVVTEAVTEAASKNTTEAAANTQQAASAGIAQMSPARLRAAILTEVKRDHVSTSAMLEGVNFVERGSGVYALIFPKDHEFALKLAQAPDSVKHLLQAFENVLGTKVELQFELEGNAVKANHTSVKTEATKPETEKHDEPSPTKTDTAAELADMFSVFGDGISFEEV